MLASNMTDASMLDLPDGYGSYDQYVFQLCTHSKHVLWLGNSTKVEITMDFVLIILAEVKDIPLVAKHFISTNFFSVIDHDPCSSYV